MTDTCPTCGAVDPTAHGLDCRDPWHVRGRHFEVAPKGAKAVTYGLRLTLNQKMALEFAAQRTAYPFDQSPQPPRAVDLITGLAKLREASRVVVVPAGELYREPTKAGALDLQAAFEAGYRASGLPWNRSHFASALEAFNRNMREG